MKLFKSTRFRWPTILAAAIVVVAAGYLAREWMQLRDVQGQFDHEWRNWQSFRNTAENVVLTSAQTQGCGSRRAVDHRGRRPGTTSQTNGSLARKRRVAAGKYAVSSHRA